MNGWSCVPLNIFFIDLAKCENNETIFGRYEIIQDSQILL